MSRPTMPSLEDFIENGDLELRKPSVTDIAGDPVSNPSHYKVPGKKIEVIDLTEELMFNRGNAVKYIVRAGRKPIGDLGQEIEDLEKAAWYIKREIKRLKKLHKTS